MAQGPAVKKLLRMMRPSAVSGGIGNSSSAGGGSAQHGGAGDARAVIARQGEMLEVLLDCSTQAVNAARAGDVPAAAVVAAKGAAGKSKAAGSGKGAGKGGQNDRPPGPRPTHWELIEYTADEIAAATDCLNPAKVAGRGLYGPLFEATMRGRDVVIKRLQLDPDTLAATAPALPLLTHLRAEAKAHVASARAAQATGLGDTVFDARSCFPFIGESAAQVRRQRSSSMRGGASCSTPTPPSPLSCQTIEAMVAAVELAVAGVRGDVDLDGKPAAAAAAALGPHPDDAAAAPESSATIAIQVG